MTDRIFAMRRTAGENVGHVSHLDMTISIAHYTGAVYLYSTYKFFIYNPNKMTT